MRRFYTVSTAKARNVKSCNGVTTAFPFDFVFIDDTDIKVTLVDSNGVETVLALTTNYTLSGGSGSSGTVTTVATYATGNSLVIERVRPYTQGDDYRQQDPLPAEVIELGLDSLTMQVQQLKDVVDRAVRLPITTDPNSTPALTLPVPSAGKALVGNAAEDGWKNASLSDFSAATIPLPLSDGGLGASHANVSAVLDTLGLSANGKSLVTAADYAAMKVLLSLVAGTDIQAYDALLANLSTVGDTLVSGDVLYASAANTLARLPKGTNGNILTLAAGLPSWSAVGAGEWQRISEGSVLSGASTYDFGFTPSSWRAVRLILTDIDIGTTGAVLSLQVTEDNFTTVVSSLHGYRGGRIANGSVGGTPGGVAIDGSSCVLHGGTLTADANVYANMFDIILYSPGDSMYQALTWEYVAYTAANTIEAGRGGVGLSNNVAGAAKNGIRINQSAGGLVTPFKYRLLGIPET